MTTAVPTLTAGDAGKSVSVGECTFEIRPSTESSGPALSLAPGAPSGQSGITCTAIGAPIPGAGGGGDSMTFTREECTGTRRGSQLSAPPRTAATEMEETSAAESGLAQPARSFGFDPGPVLPNSE